MMIKEKTFYKNYLKMWVILVCQSVITLLVNLMDNVMLGAYRETALSGVASVNQVQFVYQQVLIALGEAVVIVGTQYYGKKEIRPIRKYASIGMRAGLTVSVILFLLVSLFPEQILRFFTTSEQIVGEGMIYLNVIRFTYPVFAVTQILLATLRSVGTVQISLILSVITLITNCGINYVLIYGRFGAPEMGVTGAAIGTLTARVLELLVLLFYIKFRDHKLELRFEDYIQKTDREFVGRYVRIVAPMLVVNGLWGLNNAVQNAILGHMTPRAIAANSASSTLFLMVKSMASGASATSAYFIGKTIGSVESEEDPSLRQMAKKLQMMDILIGICAGLVLYSLRMPVLSLYHFEPETREMAGKFLTILSIIVVTMSYQMPVNNGIIRGGGDVKFVMKMDLISIWLIVIPVSLVAAFVLHLSPIIVMCCLNADQVFKCIPAFIKVNYGHWAKKLTDEK